MRVYAKAVAIVTLLGLWQAPLGWSEEIPPGKQVLTLQDCLARALASAPELGEAQADLELTASKLAEAKAHRYPQIDFTGLAGPVPQARGDQVSSPDSIHQTDRWTWFARGDATLIQPLYTFGKIAENMKAATHGMEVDRAKKTQSRNEVALKVKEYYYGLLLARELKELLLEVREDLSKARDKARKLLDQESESVEEMDLYKLDTFAGGVEKYLEEAKKGEALALAALRSRMNLPPDADLEIATARLTPEEGQISVLQAYLEASRDHRPEYRQVREGLQARAALVKAAKAAWYPDIFLAGYLSGAYAEKRDRVTNPWVPDQFNHYWGGVALGVKWKLDFGITSAKVAGEQAQYDRLLYTKEFADRNIPLQIRKFYLDLQEAEHSIKSTRDGYSNAKKWSVAALNNFDFGIGPAKEIFDGLQEYAKMRAAYFQSIYNYQIALANLAYATGEEPLAAKRQKQAQP
ncbi:MAG: TolC family protein [Geobacter sp.]|nr:MAG: TolC family protein [Geobacter sp.]